MNAAACIDLGAGLAPAQYYDWNASVDEATTAYRTAIRRVDRFTPQRGV